MWKFSIKDIYAYNTQKLNLIIIIIILSIEILKYWFQLFLYIKTNSIMLDRYRNSFNYLPNKTDY